MRAGRGQGLVEGLEDGAGVTAAAEGLMPLLSKATYKFQSDKLTDERRRGLMNLAWDNCLFPVISLVSRRKFSKLGWRLHPPVPGTVMPSSRSSKHPHPSRMQCITIAIQCSLKICPTFIVSWLFPFNTHPLFFY